MEQNCAGEELARAGRELARPGTEQNCPGGELAHAGEEQNCPGEELAAQAAVSSSRKSLGWKQYLQQDDNRWLFTAVAGLEERIALPSIPKKVAR